MKLALSMKTFFRSLIISLGFGLVLLTSSPVALAQSCSGSDIKSAIGCGVNSGNPNSDNGQDPGTSISNTLATALNVMSAVVGVLAIIMIIVGGLRFVTSGGNPEGAKAARSTVLYAVIGLIVVALAQIIVHFVLEKTNKAIDGSTTTSLSRPAERRAGLLT